MSTFTAPARTATSTRTATYRPVIAVGAAATAIAALATSVVAAVGNAAGVSLEVGGEAIVIPGFGVMTALFSVIGVVLAVALARFARRPRRTFVRTTVALTVLSFAPDLLVEAAAGTRALLMLTHVVAAVIVIPAVARRLADRS